MELATGHLDNSFLCPHAQGEMSLYLFLAVFACFLASVIASSAFFLYICSYCVSRVPEASPSLSSSSDCVKSSPLVADPRWCSPDSGTYRYRGSSSDMSTSATTELFIQEVAINIYITYPVA